MKPQYLILVRGLPGAGKSTIADILKESAASAWIKLEADMFFVDGEGRYAFDPNELHQAHNWCQKQAVSALAGGYSVVVSNTSTTEKEVAVYKEIAEMKGAVFFSIVVENRHGNGSVHNVPSETVDRMRNRFSIKL